jgi:hypothetical protein
MIMRAPSGLWLLASGFGPHVNRNRGLIDCER